MLQQEDVQDSETQRKPPSCLSAPLEQQQPLSQFLFLQCLCSKAARRNGGAMHRTRTYHGMYPNAACIQLRSAKTNAVPLWLDVRPPRNKIVIGIMYAFPICPALPPKFIPRFRQNSNIVQLIITFEVMTILFKTDAEGCLCAVHVLTLGKSARTSHLQQ